MPNSRVRCVPIAISLPVILSLAACAHQPVEYGWSHLQSGEYLFAFDTRECGEEAGTDGLAPGGAATAMGSPAFFSCMQARGYYLVDPASGRPLAIVTDGSRGVYEPQASR